MVLIICTGIGRATARRGRAVGVPLSAVIEGDRVRADGRSRAQPPGARRTGVEMGVLNDDFGTATSPTSTEQFRLDQSIEFFVTNMLADEADARIVATIAGTGHLRPRGGGEGRRERGRLPSSLPMT